MSPDAIGQSWEGGGAGVEAVGAAAPRTGIRVF